MSGSGSFGIHTSSGKLDPPLESECAGLTQVCHEKLTSNTNPKLSVRGAGSDAVGKLNLSGDLVDYVEEARGVPMSIKMMQKV